MDAKLQAVLAELNKVVLGKPEQIKLSLACMLAKGHLLIEDLPGMGKTTLSHALASVLGLDYRRIQFTSDLLPADILGASIFQRNKETGQGKFVFVPGPIFSQVVLADEINRATPKAQSALLEAMEERQVSVDGKTHKLPSPFFVIATQNPLSQAGTFPLPESQLDRFLMRIQLGYPSKEAERLLLEGKDVGQKRKIQPLMSVEELGLYQQKVQQVNASASFLDYVQRLIAYTREHGQLSYGLSPRGSLALLNASKAWAMLHGRDHVVPEDVQAVFVAVAEHRLNDGMDQAIPDFGRKILSEVNVL